MKLQCQRIFNESGIRAMTGDIIDVPDSVGHYLLSNFPAAFMAERAPVIPPDPVAAPPDPNRVETFDAPPADKMIRKPKRKK